MPFVSRRRRSATGRNTGDRNPGQVLRRRRHTRECDRQQGHSVQRQEEGKEKVRRQVGAAETPPLPEFTQGTTFISLLWVLANLSRNGWSVSPEGSAPICGCRFSSGSNEWFAIVADRVSACISEYNPSDTHRIAFQLHRAKKMSRNRRYEQHKSRCQP